MNTLMRVLLLCVLAWGLWQVVSALRQPQDTTLTSGVRWGGAALACWLLAALGDWLNPGWSAGWRDQVWYWTAVVSVCPPMAVLGARRPTNKVWNLFILCPLIAVLGWPAATLWAGWPEWRPLEVQTPALVGFALVLVMGCGNYLGTRLTWGALLSPVAVGLALLPCTAYSGAGEIPSVQREWAVAVLDLAILVSWWQLRRPLWAETPIDRVWQDFQDQFGLVWSVRILERLQAQGARSGWPCEWTPLGVTWRDDVSSQARQQTEHQIAHTLRWLLRRFVNAEWLDARGLPEGVPAGQSRQQVLIDS